MIGFWDFQLTGAPPLLSGVDYEPRRLASVIVFGFGAMGIQWPPGGETEESSAGEQLSEG